MADTVETMDELKTRLGEIKSQRALGAELKKATEAKAPAPMIAAIETRISERAKEVKASQQERTRPVKADPTTGKRAGKPAPQNSVPIAPGTFGQPGAKPLNQVYMDRVGETGAGALDLKVAFGDGKSLIRNVEPMTLSSVHPRGEDLVNGGGLELDTSGLPARVAISYVYLLDGEKPIGRCELAAPLPLAPGERAAFPAGTLVFKA